MKRSKRLTIFEGPDGGGKTTAASALAISTDAKYVHFSAMTGVNKSLARIYVEAMMPALLGYQDVVFDRSWLSDRPYGIAFRDGKDRLGDVNRRMLERLAMRCGGLLVQCLPPVETVLTCFRGRKGAEMLDNEDQLRRVYDLYLEEPTDLQCLKYDYTAPGTWADGVGQLEEELMLCHPLDLQSAGNWNAKVVLVGEDFGERKDADPWYQWPFASFSSQGCSQWLTRQLIDGGIPESDLLWVNSDMPLDMVPMYRQTFVALGKRASLRLNDLDIPHKGVVHPQAWKRFHSQDPYPLIPILQEILK
jgi:hypothetical protein